MLKSTFSSLGALFPLSLLWISVATCDVETEPVTDIYFPPYGPETLDPSLATSFQQNDELVLDGDIGVSSKLDYARRLLQPNQVIDQSYLDETLTEKEEMNGGFKYRHCSLPASSLTKENFPDLMEVVAGYLHTTELVLVANTSNYDVCRGIAWRLYRRHFATTCKIYNRLSGYYPALIMLASADDDGGDISTELINMAGELESGNIQVTHLIVVIPSSATQLRHPTQRVNYCVVQPKGRSVEFREVYTFGSPSTGPAEEVVGRWTHDIHQQKLPYRAEIIAPTDFKGNVVRVVVVHSAPHVALSRVEGRLHVDGFLAELMRVLAKRLNFSLEWIEAADQEHGIPLDNGSWTGLVGHLQRKEADIAVSPMSLTIPRLSVMDFSPAIDHDAVRMVILKDLDLDPLDWKTYIVGFHWSVWLSLVGVWIVMSIGIAKVAEPDENISTYNYLFYFMGTIAQQGCASVPECGRGRVIVFTFWIGSVLLFTSYTACLTSQLAVVPAHRPFNSLTEALTTARYSAATLRGTSYVSEMKTSRDEGLRLAYRQLMEDPTLLVNTVREGIELLHSDDRKVLFMLDVSSISYALQGNCSYMWVGPEYFPEYVYIGYRKNLSYANVFSNYISKAADYGITFKLRERYRGHQRKCTNDASFRQLSFSKAVLAFAILGSGACLGFLLLFGEVLFESWSTRQLLFLFRNNETLVKLRIRRRSAVYRQVPEVQFIKN